MKCLDRCTFTVVMFDSLVVVILKVGSLGPKWERHHLKLLHRELDRALTSYSTALKG